MVQPSRLSKSRYQSGLQCPKRLWLECFRRDLADPFDEATLAIFDQGQRVGELARERFPGGVLVAEDHTQSEAALETTATLLAAGAPCLYEAAFFSDGVFVRPDVLVRQKDGRWHLIEVKSSGSVKDVYLTDVAIQTYVLEGAGIPVGRSSALHLNKEYLYPGGAYDLEALFTLADVTAEVRAYLPEIPDRLTDMKRMLLGDCPEPPIGQQCSSPYDCSFAGYCHGFLPDFPVTDIPRLKAEVLAEFLASGIYSIQDVPTWHPGLTPQQHTVCEVIREGRPRYGHGLGRELAALHSPVHFLDFETFMPALPLYPGTRPYQVLTFQWSCHTMREDGNLCHHEFLHDDISDPRRPFVESLLAALEGDDGSIVAYSPFENTRLNELAVALPDLASRIGSLQARLVDLMKMVKSYVQHPDFHGSVSLKRVLPALVSDLSYEDLEIQDGRIASIRYLEAMFGDRGEEDRLGILASLRAYCLTDTLAMVRVFQELSVAAGR